MESGDICCWAEICYRKATGNLCVAHQTLFEGFYLFEFDCYICVCVIGEISQLVMYQDPTCRSVLH